MNRFVIGALWLRTLEGVDAVQAPEWMENLKIRLEYARDGMRQSFGNIAE